MTAIEWTDKTWNPIAGCSKVSEGCRNCYAINQAYRNVAMAEKIPNPGRLAHYEGLTEKRGERVEWTGKVHFISEALEVPFKTRKPTKWFVNSMSDLFHESVTDEQIDQIFAVMALTPRHTYQVLTKRPERMLEYCKSLGKHNSEDRLSKAIAEITPNGFAWYEMHGGWALPNVWLGVTVENQKVADERIPLLLQTPAAIRFLSVEPLLEQVDLMATFQKIKSDCIIFPAILQALQWVIVGGESGHTARPCHLEWIRSIVQQCKAANVPVFVKQLGSHSLTGFRSISEPPGYPPEKILIPAPYQTRDRKGGNIDEFPEDLRIRELPISNLEKVEILT